MTHYGPPTWTWPDWRKAKTGTRFKHNMTGRTGTYIKPAAVRNNGAIVVWDEGGFHNRVVSNIPGSVFFVSIASDATPIEEDP